MLGAMPQQPVCAIMGQLYPSMWKRLFLLLDSFTEIFCACSNFMGSANLFSGKD
jgi:hypothetical protein